MTTVTKPLALDETLDRVADAMETLIAGRITANVITQSAPTAITLADNCEYYLSNVSSLTITYPSGSFECWIRLSTASSGTISVTLPSSSYIGNRPAFGVDQTWEISTKDGVVVARQVEALT